MVMSESLDSIKGKLLDCTYGGPEKCRRPSRVAEEQSFVTCLVSTL